MKVSPTFFENLNHKYNPNAEDQDVRKVFAFKTQGNDFSNTNENRDVNKLTSTRAESKVVRERIYIEREKEEVSTTSLVNNELIMNYLLTAAGYKIVSATIATPLLTKIDELRKRWNLSRSKVLNLAILILLRSIGEDPASLVEIPEFRPVKLVDPLEEAVSKVQAKLSAEFHDEIVEELGSTRTRRVFRTRRGFRVIIELQGDSPRAFLNPGYGRPIPIEVGE